jgi:hypothetical protein
MCLRGVSGGMWVLNDRAGRTGDGYFFALCDWARGVDGVR